MPHSLDITEEEAKVDVEKHFPDAMRHVRSRTTQNLAKQWHDEVHDYNVDGVLRPTDESKHISKSFFNQGSLDIRSAGKARSTGRGTASEGKERATPDILRLTGGNIHEHGLGLAEVSNASPADPTMELDEGRGDTNDQTPSELSDMLKERLMELKTITLQEEQYTTYIPRRLNLASDEEVKRRRRNTTAILEASSSPSSSATLGDLAVRNRSSSLEGSSQEDIALAEDFLRGSVSSVPGASRLRSSRLASSRSSAGGLKPPGDSKPNRDGAVYLLRTLPRAGFCSRREAEGIITSGQVRVNNVVERNPFRMVTAADDIHVAGHRSRLRFAPPRLWMYHKPAYVIVSRKDPVGRSLITKHAAILGIDHLIPVGSLPMRSHGVLLLTNDGELSKFLEDPRSMIQQTYLLRVRPSIDPTLAHRFNTRGITINGRQLQGIEFVVNPSMKSRFSVKVKVRGETMPISQLMKHIGRTIERGGRIGVGPYSLSNLAVGSIREVTVPPHYVEHTGSVWKTFIERDWPFFRRRRVLQLRKLSKFRELKPKELEELQDATFAEVSESLTFEAQELATEEASAAFASPIVADTHPLPSVFRSNNEADDGNFVIEDITNV